MKKLVVLAFVTALGLSLGGCFNAENKDGALGSGASAKNGAPASGPAVNVGGGNSMTGATSTLAQSVPQVEKGKTTSTAFCVGDQCTDNIANIVADGTAAIPPTAPTFVRPSGTAKLPSNLPTPPTGAVANN
ncbi:MAG: hypothetical protein LBU73_09515 [Helicobacteraceae bacterium]|jgi:hypothetical protein|nr:hypothetical protein [Helicobacteraceae bacterium]